VTTDPFAQLRVADEPGVPDRRFVAGLRNRVVAALEAAGLPTIDLPDRSSTMTATTTTSRTSTAPVGATATITPYLTVTGGPAAIDWYVAVLGAVEQTRYTGDDGRIGHAELTIGGARFMLSDEYPEFGPGIVSPTTLGGTPFSMHVEVPDVDAVYAQVVADGRAAVGREPHDEAYGARSFDMIDPFGHRWMIQTPIATPTIEEIQAASEGFTITAAPTAPVDPAPVEIGYVTFGSPDTLVAAQFYGALFGWVTEPGPSGDEYAHVGNTELPMGLAPGTPTEAPVIYFRVDDIARYTARIRELGGEVVSETTYDSGPNAVCKDVQGREFQLWQPAPGY
jgi:uncharacterized glyoxalase superfamily protein PhnB/predicted enzyme related to lactoylglutathione lyase